MRIWGGLSVAGARVVVGDFEVEGLVEVVLGPERGLMDHTTLEEVRKGKNRMGLLPNNIPGLILIHFGVLRTPKAR